MNRDFKFVTPYKGIKGYFCIAIISVTLKHKLIDVDRPLVELIEFEFVRKNDCLLRNVMIIFN